ncbi:Peptidase S8/S53 domain - like 10 [Theobroma cacao]|nr:Peptidase S8/S53 domain - like 10 [Theobroma cacao]
MLLYSYNHVMHGFSARLTPSQVSELKKSPAHVATREEAFGKLFTTHSPEFLGLRHSFGLWNASSYGEGVIIALIDSGVWPESESFNEKGMPPIPTRWKGKCQNSTRNPFPCNRKLIGAQTFIKGSQAAGITDSPDDSPRDFLGHGTHTSSTAAGNHVPGASQFGYAKGIARGIAPRAHVAMYKVSSGPFIVESDVLAAMDQAISDGVDIMSLSLGFQQTPYFQDIIAIASLSAIQKGIVVVCAAGNDGAQNSTHNAAPWITTVGAGTLDRSFTATVTLGNNLTFEGKSEFPERVLILDTPLYYGKGDFNKRICNIGALNKSEVFGKVVICDNSNRVSIFDQATELANVGAVAGILMADWTPFGVDGLSIPSLVLPTSSGALIKKYAIGAAGEAAVKIMRFVLTSFGTKPAPQVAEFSSKGPDPVNPNILKPDIIAPGVQVLAAFPPLIPVGEIGNYPVASDYALLSGTSMSAPHVAGVTALLKAVHPEWSPAAIRSALMTTADTIDNNGTTLTNELTNLPGTPLEFGAGHINPNKAMSPGLIYDIDWQGLTSSQLSEIEKSPAHLATYQESLGKLFTTHSPEFLGLEHNSGLWPAASYGEGVIIGVFDTGIWPESESFNDKGMPQVPQNWKGKCENGTAFSPSACNKKLIGARSFSKGIQAAEGNISKELDYDSPRDFDGHGTHTSSTAAGNHVLGVSHFGYARGTASGVAPHAHVAMYKVMWETDSGNSAASDVLAGMDQAIADGVDIMSLSLGFDQTPYFNDLIAIASLSAVEKGIFVVCAAGNDGARNGAPWITTVGAGTLDRSFTAAVTLAPQVADFSSRGPDPVNPTVLKPDIIAPGVDVLAAVAPNRPFTETGNYKFVTDYALYSGTSMAAPHVAGVAALLKAVHPEWSPAAIRSAMMTTAYTNNNNGTALTNQFLDLPGTPLDYGAGRKVT